LAAKPNNNKRKKHKNKIIIAKLTNFNNKATITTIKIHQSENVPEILRFSNANTKC